MWSSVTQILLVVEYLQVICVQMFILLWYSAFVYIKDVACFWTSMVGLEHLCTHSHRATENSKTYSNYEAEACEPSLQWYRNSQSFGWKSYLILFNVQNVQFTIKGPHKDCICMVNVQRRAGRSWEAALSHSWYVSKELTISWDSNLFKGNA